MEFPEAYAWQVPKTKVTSMSVDVPEVEAAARLIPEVLGESTVWRLDVNDDWYGDARTAEDPNEWRVESIVPMAEPQTANDALAWSDLRPVGASAVILTDSAGAFASYSIVAPAGDSEPVWEWSHGSPFSASGWDETKDRVTAASKGRAWESRLINSGRTITWLAVKFSDGETALFVAAMSWPNATIGGERVVSSKVYRLQDLAKPLSTW